MVNSHIILKHILIIDDLIRATQVMCQIGAYAHRVVVADLPVDARSIGQLIVPPRHRVRPYLMEQLCRVGRLFQPAVLAIVLMIIPHTAKDIHTLDTIVQT